MDVFNNYPKLKQLRNEMKENVMTGGLAEQVDTLAGRYGVEYLDLAEKVLSMMEAMDHNTFLICQKYIYDYLLQMRQFLKTGNYGHHNYEEIKEKIYASEEVMMETYMPGLFLAYSNTTILYTKYHLFRNKFLPLLTAKSHGIEVGFGEGFYLWELNNHIPGIKFTGFDISEHAIAFASKIFAHAHIPEENYKLLLGDIIKGLPANNSEFDFAILAEVIEHIEDPKNGIFEIARVVRDGGVLYLSTVIDSNHMDHITNFESPEVIIKMLYDCGFEVLDKSVYHIQDDFPKSKDISVGLAFVCRKTHI